MSKGDTGSMNEIWRMQSRLVLLAVACAGGCALNADPEKIAVSGTRSAVTAPEDDAAPRRPPHCIADWGTDWSDVLHVDKAAIVSSPFCTHVRPGDPYTPEVLWITNTEDGIEGGPVLYPPGYTPRHKAPMNDFLHKLDSVRYVVQPSGAEFSFSASNILPGKRSARRIAPPSPATTATTRPRCSMRSPPSIASARARPPLASAAGYPGSVFAASRADRAPPAATIRSI